MQIYVYMHAYIYIYSFPVVYFSTTFCLFLVLSVVTDDFICEAACCVYCSSVALCV